MPVPPSGELRAQLLALMLSAIAGANGPGFHIGNPLRVHVEAEGVHLEWTFSEKEIESLKERRTPDLTPLEQQIREAAGPDPETAKRLAAKIGRSCNSHFRTALHSLEDRGILTHTSKGYSRPSDSLDR